MKFLARNLRFLLAGSNVSLAESGLGMPDENQIDEALVSLIQTAKSKITPKERLKNKPEKEFIGLYNSHEQEKSCRKNSAKLAALPIVTIIDSQSNSNILAKALPLE